LEECLLLSGTELGVDGGMGDIYSLDFEAYRTEGCLKVMEPILVVGWGVVKGFLEARGLDDKDGSFLGGSSWSKVEGSGVVGCRGEDPVSNGGLALLDDRG
jgi:hypothetical protein